MTKNLNNQKIKSPFFLLAFILIFLPSHIFVNGQIKAKKRLVRTSSSSKNEPDKIYLKLKIMGEYIQGECNISSFNRRGTIQCLTFTGGLTSPRKANGKQTGRRQHSPLRFTKFIDKTTPLLFRALCNNQKVDLAVFRFFRRFSGVEQHYYTVSLKNAYITAVRHNLVKNEVAGKEVQQMVEGVTFVFQNITWTHPKTGRTHMDSLGNI